MKSFSRQATDFPPFSSFYPIARRLDRAARPHYKPALPGHDPRSAQVAQLVEHATENRSVGGSIPPLGTILLDKSIGNFGDAILRTPNFRWGRAGGAEYSTDQGGTRWPRSGRSERFPPKAKVTRSNRVGCANEATWLKRYLPR